jgi:isopenicillin-N epimerase
VRADLRDRLRPLVVSHGYDPEQGGLRFREEWDWTGTDDPTSWLCIPKCLDVIAGLHPEGWPGLMRRNHEMALSARRILLASLDDAAAPCPDSMIGSMASVPLPAPHPGSPAARLDPWALAAWTRQQGIEGWFSWWPTPPGKMTRVSAQLYNDEEQYRALARLLPVMLREG